jgi:hypothetical protein
MFESMKKKVHDVMMMHKKPRKSNFSYFHHAPRILGRRRGGGGRIRRDTLISPRVYKTP